jgi:LmbE family N-acetylglucosaminyl deacetylase
LGREIGRPRLLGVFAHPDDEVFCAGGTLAKYSAGGCETIVVSATRGEAGQIRDASVATRSTLGTVREKELRAACDRLGVSEVRLLEHVDGTLCELSRSELVAEVAAVIEDVRPDVVITFGADGAYGHPDHVTVGEVTTEAFASLPQGSLFHSHFPRSRLLLVDRLAEWLADLSERFRGPAEFARAFSLFARETRTLGYADDQIEVAWFPPGVFIIEQGEPATSLYLILSGEVDVVQDGPDGSRSFLRRQGPGEFFGELALARGITRSAHVVAADSVTCLVFSSGAPTPFAARGTAPDLGGVADESAGGRDEAPMLATTVIDVTEFVGKKLEAIAAHRTQFPIEPEMFPSWMVTEMLGQEHFVRVHPPVEPGRDLLARMPPRS